MIFHANLCSIRGFSLWTHAKPNWVEVAQIYFSWRLISCQEGRQNLHPIGLCWIQAKSWNMKWQPGKNSLYSLQATGIQVLQTFHLWKLFTRAPVAAPGCISFLNYTDHAAYSNSRKLGDPITKIYWKKDPWTLCWGHREAKWMSQGIQYNLARQLVLDCAQIFCQKCLTPFIKL